MLHKAFPATVKAVGEGKVEAYVSAFRSTPDHQGDIVRRGAFTKSINSGRTFKMFWNHDAQSLPVGVWDHATEDSRGLKMRGRLLMGTQAGRETFEALKEGAVSDFSIGFEIVRSTNDQKSGVRYLDELSLWEASPVNFPADDQANLVGVKAKATPSARACACATVAARLEKRRQLRAIAAVVVRALAERDRREKFAAQEAELKARHHAIVSRTPEQRRQEAGLPYVRGRIARDDLAG